MNDYHKIVSFPNGYSASVVSNAMTYGGKTGLFEVGVMYNNTLVYDTTVTNDVVGFLDFAGVAKTLQEIEALPSRKS
jgi:hypothetical protein